MTATSHTQAMLAARAKDSQDKRRRALAAVQALEAAGTPVTATAVATAAGVSTWLVYADGVREHVEAARRRQAEREPVPSPAAPAAGGEPVTQASLRTDLAIARGEIRRLRAEQDKLRGRLRLQLGAEIEGPDRAELIARAATLEAASRQPPARRRARRPRRRSQQRPTPHPRTRRRPHRRPRKPAPRDPPGKQVTLLTRPPTVPPSVPSVPHVAEQPKRQLPGTFQDQQQITFISLLDDADVPIEKISRLVGHADTATTETVYRFQIRPVVQDGATIMDDIFPSDRDVDSGDGDPT